MPRMENPIEPAFRLCLLIVSRSSYDLRRGFMIRGTIRLTVWQSTLALRNIDSPLLHGMAKG